ncbi:unnamed protein product [Vitrella brassicaformis CCMP3155]|uniref:Uncharacterized protein n=2 Tax=Vitrella brassicaformis TaxID=1169539 RepID=A0A0G4EAB3_VITBC|nr:unnamed protein product [Vitrella brassicaformis CCMP3155]|eukprot:CEL92894.1 unnamed protein product [Vitrella brassicaformis CCMP3155]
MLQPAPVCRRQSRIEALGGRYDELEQRRHVLLAHADRRARHIDREGFYTNLSLSRRAELLRQEERDARQRNEELTKALDNALVGGAGGMMAGRVRGRRRLQQTKKTYEEAVLALLPQWQTVEADRLRKQIDDNRGRLQRLRRGKGVHQPGDGAAEAMQLSTLQRELSDLRAQITMLKQGQPRPPPAAAAGNAHRAPPTTQKPPAPKITVTTTTAPRPPPSSGPPTRPEQQQQQQPPDDSPLFTTSSLAERVTVKPKKDVDSDEREEARTPVRSRAEGGGGGGGGGRGREGWRQEMGLESDESPSPVKIRDGLVGDATRDRRQAPVVRDRVSRIKNAAMLPDSD